MEESSNINGEKDGNLKGNERKEMGFLEGEERCKRKVGIGRCKNPSVVGFNLCDKHCKFDEKNPVKLGQEKKEDDEEVKQKSRKSSWGKKGVRKPGRGGGGGGDGDGGGGGSKRGGGRKGTQGVCENDNEESEGGGDGEGEGDGEEEEANAKAKKRRGGKGKGKSVEEGEGEGDDGALEGCENGGEMKDKEGRRSRRKNCKDYKGGSVVKEKKLKPPEAYDENVI